MPSRSCAPCPPQQHNSCNISPFARLSTLEHRTELLVLCTLALMSDSTACCWIVHSALRCDTHRKCHVPQQSGMQCSSRLLSRAQLISAASLQHSSVQCTLARVMCAAAGQPSRLATVTLQEITPAHVNNAFYQLSTLLYAGCGDLPLSKSSPHSHHHL
jgi:hypothetical protein